MNKRIMLTLIFAVLMIAISGCFEGDDTPVTVPEYVEPSVENLILLKDIPLGFEYLGAIPTTIDDIKDKYADVAGIVDVAEGIYMYSDGTNVYMIAVECEDEASADNFVYQYKQSFPQLRSETRFVEESFNGHFATRIKNYTTFNGDVERYTYVWNSGKFVFIVEGNTDDYSLTRMIAEATGQ
ncbi:MAG: hypothetical protein JXA38_08530 [Methanosarcinaceae archaeon]|nr:hypothetical protein [Methanosarcinaceae archaeon]